MGSKSRKIILHGVIFAALLMVPPAIAHESPPCVAYAFTTDGSEGHYSLIKSNTYVFGTKITIIGNCDNNQLIIDDELIALSNNSIDAYGIAGLHDVTIKSGEFSCQFYKCTFHRPGSTWHHSWEFT